MLRERGRPGHKTMSYHKDGWMDEKMNRGQRERERLRESWSCLSSGSPQDSINCIQSQKLIFVVVVF